MDLSSRLAAFGSGMSAALTDYVGSRTYHYTHPQTDAKSFCVWTEGPEDSAFYSNNKKSEVVISGSADYYSLVEFDPGVDALIAYLDEAAESWAIEDVLYEPETGFVHYSFSWRLIWAL